MNSQARRKMEAVLTEFAHANGTGGIWLRLGPDGGCSQMAPCSGEGGNLGGLVVGFKLGREASLLVQMGPGPVENTGRKLRAILPNLERMLHENGKGHPRGA